VPTPSLRDIYILRNLLLDDLCSTQHLKSVNNFLLTDTPPNLKSSCNEPPVRAAVTPCRWCCPARVPPPGGGGPAPRGNPPPRTPHTPPTWNCSCTRPQVGLKSLKVSLCRYQAGCCESWTRQQPLTELSCCCAVAACIQQSGLRLIGGRTVLLSRGLQDGYDRGGGHDGELGWAGVGGECCRSHTALKTLNGPWGCIRLHQGKVVDNLTQQTPPSATTAATNRCSSSSQLA
jgi:hypothetical protein